MISPTFPIQNWKPFGLDQKLSGCLDPQEVAKNDYTPLMACYTANNSTKAWMKNLQNIRNFARVPSESRFLSLPKICRIDGLRHPIPQVMGIVGVILDLTNFELITFEVSQHRKTTARIHLYLGFQILTIPEENHVKSIPKDVLPPSLRLTYRKHLSCWNGETPRLHDGLPGCRWHTNS